MKHLLLSALLLLTANAFGQKDHIIKVKIEGREYDKLVIRGYGIRERFNISAQSELNNEYIFNIADSVYERCGMYKLIIPTQNNDTSHSISLCIVKDKDTVQMAQYGMEENVIINLKYIKTDIFENVGGNKCVIIDEHELTPFVNEAYIDYQYCRLIELYSRDLDQFTVAFKELIQSNPKSKYLLYQFVNTLNTYNSKNDIESIYALFSDEAKTPYLSQYVEKYLNNDIFINRLLPNAESGQMEPIIDGNGKPTLVIFSASWCAPCHKLIPTYKQIYNDLKNVIDIVYITIDEKQTIEAWRTFINDENIPWRSLGALDQSKQLMLDYYVPHIPYSFLVMPDNSITRLELREESGMKKLYEKVKK